MSNCVDKEIVELNFFSLGEVGDKISVVEYPVGKLH